MTVALQEYHGRFTIGSSCDDFSVSGAGGGAIALTNARYFIAGYTSETADQLCEHITAKLVALGLTTSTCTYSRSTGKITIDFDGTSRDITWSDSLLQSTLGFSGSQTGANSYTATNPPRYVWRPSLGPSDFPTQIDRFWEPISNSRGAQSPSGESTGQQGQLVYAASLAYSLLDDTEVIKPASGSENGTWEQFWEDVCHAQELIRIYPDKTAYTSADYRVGLFGRPGKALGGFLSWAAQNPASPVLWDARLFLRKATE